MGFQRDGFVGIGTFRRGWAFSCDLSQGPHEVEIGAVNGYGWYQMRPGSPLDQEKVGPAVEQLRMFIDEAGARYPIDKRKIVAFGFSQGGMMAYNLAMRWPDKFAALVGIGTAFPEYLVELVSDREAIQQLPTLVQHGRADPMLEIARARKSVETLRSLRVPVTFREYDCGHEVSADGIRDLSRFLMEKVAAPISRV